MVLCTSKDKATLYKDTENKLIRAHNAHILFSSCMLNLTDCLLNVEFISGSCCIGFYFKAKAGNFCNLK